MSHATFHSPLSRGQKLACTMAAAVCAAVIQVAVLAPFYQVSSDAWINPGPQLARAMAYCNSLPRPAQRDECAHQAAARARAPVTWTAMAVAH